ncbi:MAG TPA: hypothetical protein VFO83_01365 [Aggregicoccus sp.]|nr:hypothetical protein [Aggregicoccus sp.]
MDFWKRSWRCRGPNDFFFTASIPQLQEWILAAQLPPGLAPYCLVAADQVPVKRPWVEMFQFSDGTQAPIRHNYEDVLYRYPLDQLERCLSELDPRRTQKHSRSSFYIGSTVVTPALLEPPPGASHTWLSVAGLPSIGGMDFAREAGASRRRGMTMARDAVNDDTGQVVVHLEYKAIFRALRLAIGRGMRAAARPPKSVAAAPRKRRTRPAAP